MNIQIIPAIIAKSYEEFESMIKKVEPYTDRVHLDIIDGEFAPNKTIEGFGELAKFIENFQDTKLKFEVHLMVKKPENIINDWLKTDIDKYLIHWESTDKFNDLLALIKSKGNLFGPALNPETDLKVIDNIASKIDLVQLMSVHPGFYGKEFLPETADRIKTLHSKYADLKIQIDGGVNQETAKIIAETGANILVSGSYIVNSDNPGKAIKELQEAVYSLNLKS